MISRFAILLAALATVSFPVAAELAITDDTGNQLKLAGPAQRIVSLAPHVTETLFAAGAGERIVGTVDYSDFPEAAKSLPRVGGYSRFDLEAVAALKPDLVIGWESGNAPASIAKLRRLGLPVYLTQANRIEDIAKSLQDFGRLAGTEATANAAAARFRARYAQLAARYSKRPQLRVFYQIWKQPLMTINGKQIISDVIRLCGGENIFADLPVLTPKITVEGVIASNPDVIIASGMGDARPEWLDDWKRWTSMTAVAQDNLYFVPPQLIQRHIPRILDGAEQFCQHLETARAKLGKK
ncbi:MAG: cobalamin-binding protein [Betaproteobacteria bacterium]|nr:cobalamin-binding protein [Betaproteobacteria bacterium]